MFKIIGVLVQNVLNCRMAEIDLRDNGDVVYIEGKNKAGKSSLMDAVEMLFRGGRSIPPEPRNNERGEKEPVRVVAKLTDDSGETYTVKRHWTERDTYLSVKTVSGKEPSGGEQGWLDKITNDYSFRPEGFIEATMDKKVKFIKDAAGLDFSDLSEQYEEEYSKRRAEKKRLKNVQVVLSQYEELPPVPDEESTNVEALMAQRERFVEEIQKIDEAEEKRKRTCEKMQELDELVIRKQNEIMRLQAEIEEHKKERERAVKAVKVHDEEAAREKPIEQIEDIDEKIKNVEAALELKQKHRDKAVKAEEAEEFMKSVEACEKKMASIKEQKKKRIEESSLPAGVDIVENEIMYRGVPLSQASQAEEIDVAMRIAAASNPALGVIFIRKASLLDEDSIKQIKTFCKENELQLWLEIVKSEPTGVPGHFFIEEGVLHE